VKTIRIHPADERLAIPAQFFMEAAPVLVRQESAPAVRALADAMQARDPRDRFKGLDRLAIRGIGAVEPGGDIVAAVILDLRAGDGHVPVVAATAALRAGESLFEIDA
jgi:hypothetical protein